MGHDQGSGSREAEAARPAPGVTACPYLVAADGAWRASTPNKAHRCAAVAPPAPLGSDKQRRLCLTDAHLTCATYVAAREARRERGLEFGDRPVLFELARTMPVVAVRGGVGGGIAGLIEDRRGWQAIPALALVLVLVAVGWSGIGRDSNGDPSGSFVAAASPSASMRTAEPSGTPAAQSPAAPTPGPTGTPPPLPTLLPTPTPGPTATPPPSARTTYTVKSGDTLYGIAQTFGTSVGAIKTLNGLTSNIIHVGRVLLIP